MSRRPTSAPAGGTDRLKLVLQVGHDYRGASVGVNPAKKPNAAPPSATLVEEGDIWLTVLMSVMESNKKPDCEDVYRMLKVAKSVPQANDAARILLQRLLGITMTNEQHETPPNRGSLVRLSEWCKKEATFPPDKILDYIRMGKLSVGWSNGRPLSRDVVFPDMPEVFSAAGNRVGTLQPLIWVADSYGSLKDQWEIKAIHRSLKQPPFSLDLSDVLQTSEWLPLKPLDKPIPFDAMDDDALPLTVKTDTMKYYWTDNGKLPQLPWYWTDGRWRFPDELQFLQQQFQFYPPGTKLEDVYPEPLKTALVQGGKVLEKEAERQRLMDDRSYSPTSPQYYGTPQYSPTSPTSPNLPDPPNPNPFG